MTKRFMLGSQFLSTIIPILGASTVVLTLGVYELAASQALLLSETQANNLETLAYLTLTLVITGLAIVGYGTIRLLRIQRNDKGSTSLMAIFSQMITTRRYSVVFLIGSVLYAIFFSILSSILVFQPTVFFSRDYRIEVPSVNVVTCCGSLGQTPQFVIYLTDHVGLLLVPINLILMFVISLLVGLNAGVTRLAYDATGLISRKGWVGLLGAGFGLFTACPTCAGFFLSTLLGISGAFSIALGFSSLQGALIIGGVLSLIAGPVLTVRKLAAEKNCEIPRK